MRPVALLILALALLAPAVPAGALGCKKNPDCRDGDPCTVDKCDHRTKTCVYPPAANGTVCNDTDACTRTDTCQTGVCVGANPVVCAASDACHAAGTCDPGTGTCTSPPAPDGTACNDLDACTQTDACQAGVCAGTDPVVCTAVDACHLAGACDPATGVCSNPPINPLVCTPVDQCNTPGTCDPATGACTTPAKADGSPCNEGNYCMQTDACQAGVCVGSDPVVCGSGADCQASGSCDPATGLCSSVPLADGTPCGSGSGLACAVPDTCQAGVCVVGGGGDSDADGVCDASDDCVADPDPAQADLDGDGLGDVCDPDDGPLTVTRAAVRRYPHARSANGGVEVRGSFTPPASGPGAFGAAQGVAVRVTDGLTLDESQAWEAAECRTNRTGRRVLCRATGNPSTQAKLRVRPGGGDMRFTVRLGHLALAAPFGAPVTVALTSDGTIDRVGTLAACRVLPAGLACAAP